MMSLREGQLARLRSSAMRLLAIASITFGLPAGFCETSQAQDSGYQVIQGTRVFTRIDYAADNATFSNECGSQTISHRDLGAGAIPTNIIPCPRPSAPKPPPAPPPSAYSPPPAPPPSVYSPPPARTPITGAGTTTPRVAPPPNVPPPPNGACNWQEAKINVDWVISVDRGAANTFQFNLGQGLTPVDAVLAAQAHNRNAQQSIVNCYAQVANYLGNGGPAVLPNQPLNGNDCKCISINRTGVDLTGHPQYVVVNTCATMMAKVHFIGTIGASAMASVPNPLGLSYYTEEFLLLGGNPVTISAPDWSIVSISDVFLRNATWKLSCHFEP